MLEIIHLPEKSLYTYTACRIVAVDRRVFGPFPSPSGRMLKTAVGYHTDKPPVGFRRVFFRDPCKEHSTFTDAITAVKHCWGSSHHFSTSVKQQFSVNPIARMTW